MKRLWALAGILLLFAAAFGYNAALGQFRAPGALIALGLLVLLTLAQRRLEERWFIVSATLILALGLHMAFGPEWSLFGVTHDILLHLLAGFVAAVLVHALLAERVARPLLFAVLAAVLLGLGVELVQFLDAVIGNSIGIECGMEFCPYWVDTSKDLVMDLLGALAFVGFKR